MACKFCDINSTPQLLPAQAQPRQRNQLHPTNTYAITPPKGKVNNIIICTYAKFEKDRPFKKWI